MLVICETTGHPQAAVQQQRVQLLIKCMQLHHLLKAQGHQAQSLRQHTCMPLLRGLPSVESAIAERPVLFFRLAACRITEAMTSKAGHC